MVAASNDGEETPCGRACVSGAELFADETKAEKREAERALEEGVAEYLRHHGRSSMLEEVAYAIFWHANSAGDRCDDFDNVWSELREIAVRLRAFD